jgi:hypothetical protein
LQSVLGFEARGFVPGLSFSTDPATQLKETIYVLETAAGLPTTVTNWQNNTCLIVGGKFGGSTAHTTYYRVEFVSSAAPIPILRNHIYDILLDVRADGWDTPEEAYNHLPANLIVTIEAWKEDELNDVTFNDHYQLAVDKSSLTFYTEGEPKSLKAKTSYPGGWTIDATSLPSWITPVSPAPVNNVISGAANQTVTLTLSAAASPAASQALTVVPFPNGAGNTLSFSATAAFAPWTVFPNSSITADPGAYNFQPSANNTFIPRVGTLLVTLTGASNRTITTPVAIHQEGHIPYLRVTSPNADVNGEYVFNFEQSTAPVSVTIETNAPWAYSFNDANSKILRNVKANNVWIGTGITQSPGHKPNETPVTATVTFTPNTWALQQVSAGVTLYTNVFGIPRATQIITLKRDHHHYLYSENYDTLFLLPTFNRDYFLDLGKSVTDLIPKFMEHREKVTTIVFEGRSAESDPTNGITKAELVWMKRAIRGNTGEASRLTGLKTIILPDYDGAIDGTDSNGKGPFQKEASIGDWLVTFDAPLATAIGANAFKECNKLTSVNCPAATEIADGAFSNCEYLTGVYFPEVTTLGSNAFYYCRRLAEAHLPKAYEFGANVFSTVNTLGGANTFTLKTNTTTPIVFKGKPFGDNTKVTLHLNANADPAPSFGNSVTWNKYNDGSNDVSLTWFKIEEYQQP